MTIPATPSFFPPPSATAPSKTSATRLGGDLDTFLNLMLTQIRTQSPLNPIDTKDFTAQLVQFAELEQNIRTNAQNEALLTMQSTLLTSTLAGLIDSQVEVQSPQAELGDAPIEWTVHSAQPASNAQLIITNRNGEAVRSGSLDLTSGTTRFTWDGETNAGHRAAAGTYELSIGASNADGLTIPVSIRTLGRLEGLDLSDGLPRPIVNGKLFHLHEIAGFGARL